MGVRRAIFFIIVLYIFGSGAKDPPDCPGRDVSPPRKVYVIGDLHGDFDNTIAILKAAKVLSISKPAAKKGIESISKPAAKKGIEVPVDDAERLRQTRFNAWRSRIKWTGGRNIVVQLGDIADRGPDAPLIFRLFRLLRRRAQDHGGEIHLVLGNHEVQNLCADDLDVSEEEKQKHFGKPPIGKEPPLAKKSSGGKDSKTWQDAWKKAWSKAGYIGHYVLKDSEIMKVLFGRLLFVHGGLDPEFAQFTPKKLKAAYLHRIDDLKCEPPPPMDLMKVTKKERDILKVEELKKKHKDLEWDILWGKYSPIWNRELSMERDEVVACHQVEKALLAASGWSVVKMQIRTAGVDQQSKEIMDIHVHKGDVSSGDEFLESVVNTGGATAKEEGQEAKLKVMIVGHTPVMTTKYRGEGERNLILRCPKAVVSKEDSRSAFPPSGYLMADAGISHAAKNNIKFVEIKVTFHPNKDCCDCPLNVDLDFHQITVDKNDETGGFSQHSTFLMSHKES